MLKRMSVSAVLFAGLCVFVGTGHAAESTMYAGVSGAFAIENLDAKESAAKFTAPVDISFDNTWSVQARAGAMLNEYVAVELMYEFVTPFQDDNHGAGNSIEIDSSNLFVNTRLTLPTEENIIHKNLTPYVALGIGAMNVYEDINYEGQTSETSDWGLGLRGGIGLDYLLWDTSPEVSLFIEAAYTAGFGDADHVRYTTVSIGFNYHF